MSFKLKLFLYSLLGLAILWNNAFGQSAAPPPQVGNATVIINTPTIPPPLVQRNPLRVGLCLSPVLRGAKIFLEDHEAILEPLDSANRGRKSWDLGNAVGATLVAAMRAIFAQVTVLDPCTPKTQATVDLPVIVTAQLRDARLMIPGLQATVSDYLGRREGRIDLLFTLRAADTPAPLTWSISASGFAEHALLSTQDEVGIAFSDALRNVSARLLAELSSNSKARAWLAAADTHAEPVVPARAGGNPPVGSAKGSVISTRGKIAILSNGVEGRLGKQTTQCLTKALESLDNSVRILAEDQARDAFFPWFEYDVLSTASIDELLFSYLAEERARQTELEFIIVPIEAHFGDVLSRNNIKGPFTCGGGAYGAGCVGVAEVRRDSDVTAAIWDFRRGLAAHAVSGEGHAKDALIGVLLPVLIPTAESTKTHACHELASAVLDVMHGGSKVALEQIEASSSAEAATAGTMTADAPSDNADADAGMWSDEPSKNYSSIRWLPGNLDPGNSQTFHSGNLGTLRVTAKAMVFTVASSAGEQTSFRLQFDEIASVEYKTERIDGHFGKYVYFVLITRKSGQTDSLAVVRLENSSRDDVKALAKVLQLKLHDAHERAT
jgi:hypothetical protein